MLGSEDLANGAPRDDGPNVSGVAFPLLIFASDGTLQSQRDLRIVGAYVQLLGSIGSDVIIARSTHVASNQPDEADLVAVNPDTHAERIIASGVPWSSAGDANQAGTFLAVGPPRIDGAQPACTGHWFDVAGQAGTPITLGASCVRVHGVKIAPDGSLVAVAYETLSDNNASIHVLIIDPRTGVHRADHELGFSAPFGPRDLVCSRGCPSEAPIDYAGMSWHENPMTLHVGVLAHPDDNSVDSVTLPDSLEVRAISE